MSESSTYTKDFFEAIQEGVLSSAKIIVPIVVETLQPKSVVDVGCGTGGFLKFFMEYGIKDVLGVDGEYVDKSVLRIPEENFLGLDISKSFRFDRKYDLALCLEVAEHLAPESASNLIESLTHSSSIILFSAAIPLQGGDNHLNEQWLEYWAHLFILRNFVPIDAFRKKIWNNSQVEWWYRQNLLLFCDERVLNANPTLEQEYRATNTSMLSIVHPNHYIVVHQRKGIGDTSRKKK